MGERILKLFGLVFGDVWLFQTYGNITVFVNKLHFTSFVDLFESPKMDYYVRFKTFISSYCK